MKVVINLISAVVLSATLTTAATAAAVPPNGESTLAKSTAVAAKLPRRGLSMAMVERTWGAPVQKLAAVGEPPISRWVYNDFTVYFENQTVIHSVAHTPAVQAT